MKERVIIPRIYYESNGIQSETTTRGLVIDFAKILCASCDAILCDHFLIEIFALVMQIKRVHCLDVVGLNN